MYIESQKKSGILLAFTKQHIASLHFNGLKEVVELFMGTSGLPVLASIELA